MRSKGNDFRKEDRKGPGQERKEARKSSGRGPKQQNRGVYRDARGEGRPGPVRENNRSEKQTEKQTAGARRIWQPGNMLYPLPAVMVSCAREGEKPNILTVAWTGTVCSSPAMVSISVRPERYSYGIIRETGEFVLNLTTERLAEAADFCGVRSGRDTDKFERMHLTAGAASQVRAPLILESPVNLECRVEQVLELGSHHMFLARVLAVDVDENYLDEKGKLDLSRAGLIAYSHGEYFGLGEKLGSFGYSVKRRKN